MRQRRTNKQRELMAHILSATDKGCLLNVKQLHELVSYKCTYGAVRVSVRVLEKRGFIVKQREGVEVKLAPTTLAYEWFPDRSI